LANMGIVKTEKIKIAVTNFLQTINTICSIFTFGYGDEPDPEFLTTISDTSSGMHYYMEKEDDIPKAFTDCIGGLLSVVAQNLVLTIEGAKGIQITEVLTTYRCEKLSQNSFRIFIDDIYSEEQKDILCKVSVPILEGSMEENILTGDVTYKNVVVGVSEFCRTDMKLTRNQEIVEHKESVITIDKQRNRIIVAKALNDVMIALDRDEDDKAQEIIQQAQQQIEISPSSNENFTNQLLTELNEVNEDINQNMNTKKMNNQRDNELLTAPPKLSGTFKSNPTNKLNKNREKSKIKSKMRSHFEQRSTNYCQTYVTNEKQRTQNKYFDDNYESLYQDDTNTNNK